jgi:hypothetical protein
MAEKVALHDLPSGFVLDRNLLLGMNAKNIATTIEAIRSQLAKSLTVVDSATTFFTSENMLKLIKTNDDDYKLIAEKTGVEVRDEDVDAIRRVENIINAMKPPTPPYTFYAVPEKWSVGGDLVMTLGASPTVRRKPGNSQGLSYDYSISLKQLNRVWVSASRVWLKNAASAEPINVNTVFNTVSGVRVAGYSETARIQDGYVRLGCQNVQRYELEQLALHLGWDFPTAE